MLKAFFLSSILILPGIVNAATYFQSDVDIASIASFSSNRPADSSSNNTVRLEVPGKTWGEPCGTVAYIDGDDKNLISTLYTAWSMGKRIDIEVDSTEAVGNKCKVTFIKMVK